MAKNYKQFKLLDVATISGSRVSQFEGVKKYIATADIDFNKIVSGEDVSYLDRPSRADLVMTNDDVLFAKMKSTKKVLAGVADVEDLIFSTGFYILKPNDGISKKYLYFYLLSDEFNRQKDMYCSGATMAALGNSGLSKILISIPVDSSGNPDVKEQERVACLLEEAEILIQKRTEADQKMEEVIPALFHEMFGDIRENDKQWSVVRFSEIGKSRLGKMLDAKKQTGKNKKPYIKNTNVKWGHFDLGDLPEMDFSEDEQEEFRLKSGDLLICEGGEIGRTAIWKDELVECYFQKALHRVRLDKTKAVPEYIAALLHMMAKKNYFRELTGTATIPHLTGVQLASIRIPLPPTELQNEFAERVKEVVSSKEKRKVSAMSINELSSSLMSRAFA